MSAPFNPNDRMLRALRGIWLLVTVDGAEDEVGKAIALFGKRLRAAVAAGDADAAMAIREEVRTWWSHLGGAVMSRANAALQEPGQRRRDKQGF